MASVASVYQSQSESHIKATVWSFRPPEALLSIVHMSWPLWVLYAFIHRVQMCNN